MTAIREQDHTDIQGNLLTPYALPYGAFLLVNIADGDRGRAWLDELVERVTSAGDQDRGLTAAWNVAFTYEGLQRLGVPERFLRPLPQDFREGMEARAADRLEDIGESDPGCWEEGLRQGDGGHAMVMLRAKTDPARDELVEEARQLIGKHELTVVYDDASSLVPESPEDLQKCGGSAREHFGFADGCSQPAIEGSRAAGKDKYQRVKAGEFLLGYRDFDGLVTGRTRFFRNGSFMVFRKLEQRVAAFRRILRSCELPDDLVAAKIVGRWDTGEPLVMDQPDRHSDSRPDLNDFRYGSPMADGPADDRPEDPWGERCPLGAHIRRAFPRDALVGGDLRTRRHRILRRGMPYGEALPENAPDDAPDEGRGLLFICFNASIARQFEIVQSWCLDGNLFDVPGEPDFLLAPAEATMTIKHDGRTYRLRRKDPLVVTRGGGYFLYPGIGALRAIATRSYAGQEDRLPA
ncbi:MAG TPA: Dyp-type peroxidase [Thermoleophilaceae bacterium]|nr:Dyp-type peroxidase [Thermoleophilaceae bacterium]